LSGGVIADSYCFIALMIVTTVTGVTEEVRNCVSEQKKTTLDVQEQSLMLKELNVEGMKM